MMHKSVEHYSDYELTLAKTMANNVLHDFARYVAPCGGHLHSNDCSECSVRELCTDLKMDRLYWNQQHAIRTARKEREK